MQSWRLQHPKNVFQMLCKSRTRATINFAVYLWVQMLVLGLAVLSLRYVWPCGFQWIPCGFQWIPCPPFVLRRRWTMIPTVPSTWWQVSDRAADATTPRPWRVTPAHRPAIAPAPPWQMQKHRIWWWKSLVRILSQHVKAWNSIKLHDIWVNLICLDIRFVSWSWLTRLQSLEWIEVAKSKPTEHGLYRTNTIKSHES